MNSIHDICKEYNITNYTINDDGSIDVNENVELHGFDLTELPLTFNKVSGYFDCTGNQLTTLKGSPRWVGYTFYCGYNNLTSLEFSPDYICYDFKCNHNNLTSLEFSPEYVGSYFDCRYNYLNDNYCDSEIGDCFYTTLRQSGLIFKLDLATNYHEWRKMYKRKLILNDIFNM